MSKVLCTVFGHKYNFIKKISSGTDLICCGRCNKLFAINHRVEILLEWDEELELFYKEHKYVDF